MRWEREGGYAISTSMDDFDPEAVRELLDDTYWASGRSVAEINQSAEHSLCFSVLHEHRQIGFGRVVTDHTFVAWILDVVIAPEFRGKGLGYWLVTCILEHPSLESCIKLLRTKDAHGLYRKFGFTISECMELKGKDGRPGGIP